MLYYVYTDIFQPVESAIFALMDLRTVSIKKTELSGE